jgi:hypothetical protein
MLLAAIAAYTLVDLQIYPVRRALPYGLRP